MDESKENRVQIAIEKMNISDNDSIYELVQDLTGPIEEAIVSKINEILRNRIIPNLVKQFHEAIKNFAETLNGMDIQKLVL